MIDIHSHILPNLDDGSQSLNNALFTLSLLEKCGVSDLFLTPHLLAGDYEYPPEKIKQKIKTLSEAATKRGISVKLRFGAEYYLTGEDNEENIYQNYCLGESKYILIETSLSGFPINMLEILYKLVTLGFKPILAHPERYPNIISNPDIAEDFVYRNVYLQANAGSFMGMYGKNVEETVWELLDRGLIHFIASDFHSRYPEEVELLIAKEDFSPLDDEQFLLNYPLWAFKKLLAKGLHRYPIDLLTKSNPDKIISNDNVAYLIPSNNKSKKREKKPFLQKLIKILKDE